MIPSSSSSLFHNLSNHRFSNSFRSFFFIPTTLALVTCLFILIYISSTSKLFFTDHHQSRDLLLKPSLGYSLNPSKTQQEIQSQYQNTSFYVPKSTEAGQSLSSLHNIGRKEDEIHKGVNANEEVFHDEDIFMEDYNEMNRSFKIYVYPHRKDDPYAHALLPVDFEPGGNYASESYFKKALMQSHFITEEPAEANLFSCLSLLQACGMTKEPFLRCLSFHWKKETGILCWSYKLSIRKKLLEVWKNDSEIYVNFGRLRTPYSDALLGSKFCLHVKGFEVNTARIGDALYYGCVPVIIANHYDLPFTDILNWKSFSLVVDTSDIPLLKKILHGVSSDEYRVLQRNALKVRKHFQWNLFPTDYDAFYMVMYELWLRRNSLRFTSSELLNFDHQHNKTCMK
ncbi:hypothetical protein IFM89_012391 [Coptis chinensis]|uniref:Exostosin GT47 domain-containing protein n=1 Tax=Coptis chinensis TaxID=261450 RepID=A0A835IDM0_9MAGN|nr:hypothetical protein IFM89_012391 [Coptis chinensis]